MIEQIELAAQAALTVRTYAYAPYSGFAVGAALLDTSGNIHTGCNIENASYPVGICAERVAMSKAVSMGVTEFKLLVIAGAPAERKGSDFCAPCGLCRQFIREFCGPEFPVVLIEADETRQVTAVKEYTIEELLPESFGPENLKGGSRGTAYED